jgi:predicted O-methyltransferase YrrM
MFKDRSIDFLFLDTEHSYEHVKEEILAWYPKIKTGGIIAGHDFDFKGVHRAVKSLIRGYNVLGTSWYKIIG